MIFCRSGLKKTHTGRQSRQSGSGDMRPRQFLFHQIRFKSLLNNDPQHLFSSFITALECLATQSKTQNQLKFKENDTAIKKN